MTNRKLKQAIARVIFLVLTIVVISLTVKTLSIGVDLAIISLENANTESWRQSEAGIAAANSVYERNMKAREAIYNSKDNYTKWLSTSNDLMQLGVFFFLLGISLGIFSIWYKYITIKIKNLRKRLMRKNYIRTTDKQLDN